MHISKNMPHRLPNAASRNAASRNAAPWRGVRPNASARRGIGGSVWLAAVAVILGVSNLAGQEEGGDAGEAAAAVNTTHGVFSEEQATRGEDVFYNICAECHFEEDFGGPFIQSWVGASVKDLLDEIVATMPEDNPGGLPSEQYVDVITYMFKINGLPTGEDELTAEDLEAVEIEVDLDP